MDQARAITDALAGELEATITRSFQRASALRRWISRVDQPAAISAINKLLQRSFPAYETDLQENYLPVPTTTDNMNPDEADSDCEPDGHIKDLIHANIRKHAASGSFREVIFRKRVRHNGVILSTKESHVGNSWIEFWGASSQRANDTCIGNITKIAFTEFGIYLAVHCLMPLPTFAVDPFAEFIDFPGKMYSSKLEVDATVIEIAKFKNHIAYYRPDSEKAVVVSLCRY